MAHVEPTAAEVQAFTGHILSLVEAAEELGQAKALYAVADGNRESVKPEVVQKYDDLRNLAAASVLGEWESVRLWMADHLPPGPGGCTNPHHAHE
jgi:hypothetical protein